MASPSSSASAGGVLVMTQVYPSQQQCNPQRVCVGTQSFIRAHPLAVGTVQIMIGVMVLLFGIVTAIRTYSFTVDSGIFAWGAIFYITSGSLTVAAGKSLSRCLVNTSLGFNVVASVVSLAATVLSSLDAAGILINCYHDTDWPSYCYRYKGLMMGFSGVLAVFHFLEFIISITVSAFACKATCNCGNEQVFVVPANASPAAYAQPASNVPVFMAQPPPQVVGAPTPEGRINPGFTDPPAYTVSIPAEHTPTLKEIRPRYE